MYRYQMLVPVKQCITWVCANIILHGFIAHTPCHYCEMVATAAGNKVSKHLHGGGLKSCKLRMRVKFKILVRTNIFPLHGFLHLQLIHILALSPHITVYIAWVLAKHIQVWNQDSLGYGMESGWCRLHYKPFSGAQLYWRCGTGF